MLTIERIVNSIFSSITYVLSSEKSDDIWLVDCGDTDKLFSSLSERSVVKGVLLTHTHFDHIYGLNRLLSAFPACVVYTTTFGKEALYSDRLNFSQYHEESFVFEGGAVQTINEPCVLTLSEYLNVEVIPTPGHSPDCLSYIINERIFTGDSYIPGIKTVTTLRGGNKEQALKSTENILHLCKERGLHVCAGHLLTMKSNKI